jgi:hypothetical protein
MSLNYQNLFASLDVAEHIPNSAQLPKLKASSVIKERKTARYVPVGSTSYSLSGTGSAGQLTFRISDAQGYIDPATMYLNFNIQINETISGTKYADTDARAWTCPDDGFYSLFQRARISVNSVVAEDLLQANTLINALIYSNCDRQVYDHHLGLLAGSWKFNQQLAVGSDTASIDARRIKFGGVLRTGTTYNVVPVSIPLSLFFDFCRQNTYMPLRNMGHLQIELFFDDLKNAFVTALNNAGVPGTLTVSLTNVNVTADILTMDALYVSSMDRIMSSAEAGDGFKVQLNTYLVADSSMPTGDSVKNIVYAKSTPQLRSMLFWYKNNANINDASKYAISQFDRKNAGNPSAGANQGFQIRIGSDIMPLNPLYGYSEQFRELTKMFGGFSMLSNSLQNLQNYCPSADSYNSAYTFGVSFDKNVGEHVTLDGYDASISSMINVQVYNNIGGAENYSMTSAINYSRYLVVAGGQVQMIGM